MIIDVDLDFVVEATRFFDSQIEKFERSEDYERAEYVIGLGFVTCQQYVTAVYGRNDVPKDKALALGPKYRSNLPIVAIVNASANYWKHSVEWGEPPYDPLALRTIAVLEEIGVNYPESYLLSNVLAKVLSPLPVRLGRLTPFLQRWRDELLTIRTPPR